jgi:hypothetical protein
VKQLAAAIGIGFIALVIWSASPAVEAQRGAGAPAEGVRGAGAPAERVRAAGAPGVKSAVADAAMRGDKAAIQKLLAQKADVNAPQSDGATALHWAVFHGDKDLVQQLVRAGANVGAANREGATPLWLASVLGDASILSALIEGGGDPNEKLPALIRMRRTRCAAPRRSCGQPTRVTPTRSSC